MALRGGDPAEPATEPSAAPSSPSGSASTAALPASAPARVAGEAAAPSPRRGEMRASADARAWRKGAAALVALAAEDPAGFEDRELRAAAVAIASGIAFEGGPAADGVFDALSSKVGPPGLEVLWELMRAKGGTKAARRATALLHDPEVLARGTPGLRVAVDLRRASCAGKRALFERAAAEGDARVLAELHILGADRCRRAKDPCCFRGSEDLERAMEARR